jgi:hypothetical protein
VAQTTSKFYTFTASKNWVFSMGRFLFVSYKS